MSPKEIIGVKPTCNDCGWEGEIYRIENEGNIDCTQLSAIIETRLGHCIETGHKNIKYVKIFEEKLDEIRKAFRRE